ncbi:hypothetical protein ACSTWK_005105, partial [Escherichia coli]
WHQDTHDIKYTKNTSCNKGSDELCATISSSDILFYLFQINLLLSEPQQSGENIFFRVADY